MSETWGSYSIPNPIEGDEFPIVPGEDWTLANGNEVWHTLAQRKGWTRTYVVKGTDLTNLRAAITAGITSEFSFTPYTGTAYYARVVGQSVRYSPETPTATTYWRVVVTLHQVRTS